jgi:DNA-binding sugar fermentation-stimulating protein
MNYKKTQIIKCPKCNAVFAACLEPNCYIDKDWLKSLKKYIQEGFEVDYVQQGNLQFSKCTCKNEPIQGTLF